MKRFYEADGGQGGNSGTKTVEQLEGELLEMQKTIESVRKANLEIAQDRKNLKEQIEQVKNAELLEQGKFKEIAEKYQKELEELKPYKEKAETLEKMVNDIETATKTELLNALSEEHKLIATKLNVADLREYVKLNTKENFSPDQRKSGQLVLIPTNATWEILTDEQKRELLKKDPERFNKLQHNKIKR